MSFSMQWQKQLSDPRSHITTVLVNHIGLYSASNGYVCRHDPLTDENLSQTSLRAYGTCEVRLAAPASGELLVVGINGHIAAMDPTSLEIQWVRSLPKTENGTVILLIESTYIYTTCKSYIRCLDLQTGQILAGIGLSRYDFTDLQLALSDDSSVLFLGMNVHVLALPAPQLDTVLWCCELSGVDKGVTSVIHGAGVVYAGYDGCVFRIESSSGKITHINNLGDIGKSEIRFAVNDLRNHLWVGTNGYGIALQPNDIATIFSEKLSESDRSITEVVEGDGVAYFANNGYVSCLGLNGRLVRSSKLPFSGKAETRLSVNRATELVVGINGHCMLFTLPEFR